MNFQSLDELNNFFEITAKNNTEAKRVLKAWVKKIHPDNNRGEFRNINDKEKFIQIQSAFEFLEKKPSVAPMIISNEISELAKIVTDLNIIKRDNEEKAVEKKEIFLGDLIKDSVKYYQNKNITPKVTSTILISIITFLWIFPETIKKKPELSFLYFDKQYFTIIWFFSLLFLDYFGYF